MSGHTIKLVLKRGALVAAANWPVVAVQAMADWLFKALVAMPLVGSVFLVALVVGAEPGALLELEWRELGATVLASLQSRPIVFAAFLASLTLTVVGGSAFVFLVKGGTIGVLVRSERVAGAIEQWPLRVESLMGTSTFTPEAFIDLAWGFFPRFARLGALLIATYAASGAAALALSLTTVGGIGGLMAAAALTVMLVVWFTLVNFVYLLLQIVIAADDCTVTSALTRVAMFVRRGWREVSVVFLVVLALVVASTGASLLAATALGLIAFVPLLGVAVLPLQLLAWVMRSLVSEYIDVTSISAYLRLYRESGVGVATVDAPVVTSHVTSRGV